MDQLIALLTRRNIIALIILSVLAVGLLVGLRLVQQQTQLKSQAQDPFTCFPITTTPSSSAGVGDQIGINVGGRTNDGNNMDKILVYVKASGQDFTQLGQEVSCSSDTCAGPVTWNSGALNNGPGSYIIAQRLINELGGERNTEVNDPQCQKSYTLTGATQPPPPPPPPPATGQKFTIGGKVTRKDNDLPIGNIIINQGASPGANNKACNIGTATTDRNGRYAISNVDSGTLFCLRPPSVAGYTKGETSGGAGSYENQTASSNKTDYDFVYTPGDAARAEEFNIFDRSGQDVTTRGTIISGEKYTFKIEVKNTGLSTWKKDVYKLKAASSTKNDWQLEQEFFPYKSPEGEVTKDNVAFFELEGTAPEISGDVASKRFEMAMYNGSNTFAQGVVNITISIRKTAGGPGASPPPVTGFRFRVIAGGSVQLIPGGPSQTTDVTVVREDNNTSAPNVTVTAIGFPSGVTFSFDQFAETNRTSRTCTPTIQSPCNLDLTMRALTSAPTSIITVRATHGDVSSTDEFGLVVGATTTAFNFSITKPSDVTLTKGQSDSGRDITVSRTAGDAEDVSLSVIGDIGGAIAIFRPSESCKPDSGNRCQRVLAFDTSQATPGDYSPVIEGRGTGGRVQESLPFRLKINPPAATVTCFVVSERLEIRDGFLSCGQSVSSSDGIKGSFGDTPSIQRDFPLSANNGNKTLHARFLKLLPGESITACNDANKCKDTTAGITLNAAAPSPSPSPPPPPPPPPPSPPPAPVCNRFELSGLTKSSTRNSDGGPIYTASSQGSNNQFDISFTPGSATVVVTAISQTTGAPDLTITETNTGTTIVRVANIPPNTSETQDNTYRIRATVTSGIQEVNCLPIQVIVPKIGTGVGVPTTCPADIQSTEVKFRNADNSGDWIKDRTITLGQSVKVGGFHNGQTPATPSADVELGYVGPKGITSPPAVNGGIFTPSSDPNVGPGAYVFTATTTGKTGAKCTGTATLVVTAPSPSPPPAVGTGCFFIDDKPIIGKSCTDEGAQAYDTHPKVVPLTLTTAGKKVVFVRFISNLGATRDLQRVVNFTPNPKITEASCAHSLSGSGSVVTLTVSAAGERGKGKVKVGGADANIITWNDTTGLISATLDKRIEGKNDVEVIRDDGKTAKAECTVGTTSVLFVAQSQCKSGGNFAADNVSVKIFANAPATVETEKPQPIISEKVKLDKDGKPSGFAPKLEKDKKYSLIVKSPGTLAKRVDFETKGGTRNLDPTILLIGDIAPATNPDGKINAFDRSELTRQWNLVKDVQRSGDFNQDGRVNSIDYACMRGNINQSDESFSPPTGAVTAPSSGVGTTAPSGIGTTSPTVTPSPSPSPSSSPSPAGGPSGILPFRVSFDANFATSVMGDMGVDTTKIVDLTLPAGPGLKSIYVQFYEDGVWGPTPPQTASILLK